MQYNNPLTLMSLIICKHKNLEKKYLLVYDSVIGIYIYNAYTLIQTLTSR